MSPSRAAPVLFAVAVTVMRVSPAFPLMGEHVAHAGLLLTVQPSTALMSKMFSSPVMVLTPSLLNVIMVAGVVNTFASCVTVRL